MSTREMMDRYSKGEISVQGLIDAFKEAGWKTVPIERQGRYVVDGNFLASLFEALAETSCKCKGKCDKGEMKTKLSDGTEVIVNDVGVVTKYKNHVRHYDWKDLRVMNQAIATIAGMRKQK